MSKKSLSSLDDAENEAQEALVQQIRDLQDENITAWEEEFLSRIEKKVLAGCDLTTGERDKLEEIQERVDDGGNLYDSLPF